MWSKDKKFLEDHLAQSLVGKIEYQILGGHRTTWGAMYKFDIMYNKQSVISFKEGIEYNTSFYELAERQPDDNDWSKEESYRLFLLAQDKLWKDKIYTSSLFFKGMTEYLSLSIDDALNSKQWMIRLFAILDKRCGKRRLIKLADEINNYPEKLQEFYLIRLSNENIPYRKNEDGQIVIG